MPQQIRNGRKSFFVDTEIWKMDATPQSNDVPYEDPAGEFTFVPPQHGNICRILEIPPDKALGDGEEAKPLFHRTASLDYAFVIKGEIHAVLDGGEKLMKAGDILVQRGTIHAWSNRSSEPCLMLFVLCGADEIEGLPVL